MQIENLRAEARPQTGRRAMQRLRSTGRLPAVVYGLGEGNSQVTVDAREFDMHLRRHHRVFHLEVGGKQDAVLLHDLQFDALTDRPMHVDFKRIDLTKKVEVEVELVYVGHPVAASKGWNLRRDMVDLPIVCLPTAIPESIEVGISHLDEGAQLLAGDLVLPEGVEIGVDPDTIVCAMELPAKVAAPAEPAAGEAGEQAAEAKPEEGKEG